MVNIKNKHKKITEYLLIMFKKLIKILFESFITKKNKHRPKISILIPFSSKEKIRKRNFKWLLEYWKHELPDAEIIIGRSTNKIFCKGEAFNNAVRKSTGKVIVIMDADAYMLGETLDICADRILDNLKNHLWYVPYRHLYRLNEEITEKIVESDPSNPLRMPSPLPPDYIDENGHNSKYGHHYGAMCMMFPREAYDLLGCFDENFKGWGGEDVALLRAIDTLYGKHKTFKGNIYHLWHPFMGNNYKTRIWDGQEEENPNWRLTNRYNRAYRNPHEMRELVNKGCKDKNYYHKEKKNNQE